MGAGAQIWLRLLAKSKARWNASLPEKRESRVRRRGRKEDFTDLHNRSY
jgi:hypothetical protein